MVKSTDFSEGLYLWDGAQWREYKAADQLVQTADNGLTLSNNHIQWGGNLTKASTVIGINAAAKKLVFNTTNNTAGDEAHGVFFRGLQVEGSTQALTVTPAGKLGIASNIPAKLAFFQSSSEQTQIATSVNAGTEIVVTFSKSTDEVSNNLMGFDDTNDEFIAEADGILEISASVAYSPLYSGITTSTNCLLNATLQVKGKNASSWTNYSSVRTIWVGAAAYYRQTMNIPPVLLRVYKGDRLRMIVQRPPDGASGYLGDSHGDAPADKTPTGIAPHFGTSFSKTIKILGVE